MPILLMLALGASVVVIAMRVAEAAEGSCPDEAMRNVVLTTVAVFKQRVDGIFRVTPEAEASAKAAANRCQIQLIDFLKRNPALALELKKAQEEFLKKGTLLEPVTLNVETEQESETEQERLTRRRDELFRKLGVTK